MNLKLYVRVAVLTGMLFMLVSTFKTQTVGACSPGWYEGCLSGCGRMYDSCMSVHLPSISCDISRYNCETNCDVKLKACVPN